MLSRGERAADRVAALVGSWRFIGFQTICVIGWIIGNAWLMTRPFDPFPFVLLNLGFSLQAAYTGPILQLAGNRQADRVESLAAATNELVAQLLAQVDLLRQLAGNEQHVMATLTAQTEAIASQSTAIAAGLAELAGHLRADRQAP